MCNFYMMFYYDPDVDERHEPESCAYINENSISSSFPSDADKPKPEWRGAEMHMHMKRQLEGK